MGKIFGHQESLTPEVIASWLVSLQRPLFDQIFDLLKQDREDVARVDSSVDALAAISFNIYLCHLAIVSIVFQDCLDDTKILQGGPGNGADLFAFTNRVHNHARKVAEPELRMDANVNPFPSVPFAVEFEDHLPDFTFYYSSFFVELDTLRRARPEPTEYAETMIAEMNTTNLLLKPISLAYYQAHRLLFSPGNWKSKYNQESPDMSALSVILRTWQPWCVHFINFPQKLQDFAGTRQLTF